jgi:hypothetical protein
LKEEGPMPLRVNEITSNVEVMGGETSITDREIEKIVRIALARVKEELEHQMRISEEISIRDQASEIEPY